MKNIKFIHIIGLAFVILFFHGCSMPAGSPLDSKGNGIHILIDSELEAIKTFSPDFTEQPVFVNYSVTITGGTVNFTMSSSSRSFVLSSNEYPQGFPYGTYTVTVTGYRAGEDNGNYSARGSRIFTFSSGARSVLVKLSPVYGEGAGILNYTIIGDGSVTLRQYDVPDPEPPEILDPEDPEYEAPEWPKILSGSGELSLPAGFYRLDYGVSRPPEIVHIYRNFTTKVNISLAP